MEDRGHSETITTPVAGVALLETGETRDPGRGLTRETGGPQTVGTIRDIQKETEEVTMEDPNMTISGPEVQLSPVAGDLLMVLLELPVHSWVLLPRLQLGLTRQSQQSTLTSPHKLIKSGKF